MADLRYLELLDDDRQYITEHWKEIENLQSSILQPVNMEKVYLKSVFSWIGNTLEGNVDGISRQMMEYYANHSNEVVLASYDNYQAVVILDLSDGQVSSASFKRDADGDVQRVPHFVNHTLQRFYQSVGLFDHYRALILEQPNKEQYLYQLMKALMALDKQLIINNDPNNHQFWNLECLRLYEQYVLQAKIPILSRDEEIGKILERAGWYPDRRENVAEFKQYCYEEKLNVFPALFDFLEQYNGLTLHYATYYHSGNDIARRVNYLFDYINTKDLAKRKYMLVPTLDLMHPHISAFNRIAIFAEEPCVAIGEFGYYHSLLTLGKSGTFYLTHEFSEEVEQFDTLAAVIAWDMEQTQVVTDSLILNNQEKMQRLNQVQSQLLGYTCLEMMDIFLKNTYASLDEEEWESIVHRLRTEGNIPIEALPPTGQLLADERIGAALTTLTEMLYDDAYFKAAVEFYHYLLLWHQRYGWRWQKLYEETFHAFLVDILYQNGYRCQKSLREALEQYSQKLALLDKE